MSKVEWISPDKDSEEMTLQSEIPNRDQMQEFVRNLGKKSRDHVALRNQALALLLWDKGPRIREALSIKLQNVEVKGSFRLGYP